MAQSFLGQKRLRKYYGKIREVLEMPNLIEVQKSSYDLFLNSGDAEPPPMVKVSQAFSSRFSRSRILMRPPFLSTSSTSWKSRNTMLRNVSSVT